MDKPDVEERSRFTVHTSSSSPRARLLALLLAAVLTVTLAGCRSRSATTQNSTQPQSAAQPAGAAVPAAPGDPAHGAVEKAKLSIPDTTFDLPFAMEQRESFKLEEGAVVKLESLNGRISVEKSTTGEAEVYIVRSVDKSEDLRNRKLSFEHNAREVSIRMEREKRSALFAMFSDRGREKQRVVVRLPGKADLEISGVSGRIDVGSLDGDVVVEGVNGKIQLAQIAGRTSVSDVNGSIKVTAEASNRKELRVNDVNGNVEILFNGEVNADLRFERIHGRVEPNFTKIAFDGERRRNDFRATVGKGGALVEVTGINGNVWLAPSDKPALQPLAAGPKPVAEKNEKSIK